MSYSQSYTICYVCILSTLPKHSSKT